MKQILLALSAKNYSTKEMKIKTSTIERFSLSCLLSAVFCILSMQANAQTPYTITWEGLQGNTLAQNVPTGITVTQQYNGVTAACNTGQNGPTTSYTAMLTAAPGYNFTITSIGGAAYASSAGSRNFSVNLANGAFNGTGPVTTLGATTNCGGNTPLTPYAIPAAGQTVPAGTTVTITVLRAPGSASGNGYSWTRSLTVTGVITPVSAGNTISTSAVTAALCAGAAISVPFTATGTFSSGNIFTAQLSNAAGSFANPVNIGTLAGTVSGTINATIPIGAGPGNGYRIRVVSSNPATTGTDNGTNITINATPVVNLGNDTSFCAGTALNITLNAGNPGASYQWSNFSTSQTLNVSTAGTFSVTVTSPNNCVASDQIVVTENAQPVVNLGSDLSYCTGSAFTQILDAGNAGSSYQWSDASNLQTLNITQAGIYSVIVTDLNGCEKADTIVVTENALPTVSLGSDLAYCIGDNFSAMLDAGNVGATYNWNNGLANTQTFTATSAGTYSVTVTDANGCENTDDVVVIENPLPVVDLGNNVLSYCAGSNFSQLLDAGNPGATYSWTKNLINVANTQTYTATSAGIYGVVVTDANGCQNIGGVAVVENALPTVNLGADIGYCAGTVFSQILDAGNPGASYNWNNGLANTQTFTATSAGTYSVTVTDANGCENTDALVVVENITPTVNLGNDLSYCVGSNFSTTLDAGNPGASYDWNNGVASTQTFNITTAGNYSVIVTDANGCQGFDLITVTQNNLPIVQLGNDTAYCAGTPFSVLLNAGNPGATYSWNGGSFSSQIFAVSQAGTYSVVVTDANGCANTDEVIITEYALPVVNIGNDTSYCVGTPFSLVLNAGNPGSTYAWGNGSITQTITATQAGVYSVTVTNSNGCVNSDQLVVTENALPVINLGNDVSTTNTFYVLDAGAGFSSYLWTPGGQNTPQLTVTQSGTYSVTVTSAEGCSASDQITVTLGTVSIFEIPENKFVMSIFPNPASEQLNIKLNEVGTYRLEIFGNNGKSLFVQEKIATEPGQVFDINLQTWAQGWYYIRVSNSFQSETKMFYIVK